MADYDGEISFPPIKPATEIMLMPADGVPADQVNIECGIAGRILFLLEQYASTGDEGSLERAGHLVNELLLISKNTTTRDYSLYKGRGGTVYVFLQYYFFTGDRDLIRQCVDLMKPVTDDFLQSGWTSDYLYDGRAGSLLVLWMLFQLTDDPEEVLPAMRMLLDKIIDNAQLSREGLFWAQGDDLNGRASCGMAFGTAGILYVLKRIAGEEPDPTLRWVIDQSTFFLTGGWDESLQNWGNSAKTIKSRDQLMKYKTAYLNGDDESFGLVDALGWADGAAGILLAGCGDLPVGQCAGILQRLIELDPTVDNGDFSLFEGSAGIGLALLEIGRERGMHALQDAARLIATRLKMAIDRTDAACRENMDINGLLQGRLGIEYFFLRLDNPDGLLGSMLQPSLPRGLPVIRQFRHEIGLERVRGRMLTVRYPRTVGLLEAVEPKVWKVLITLPVAEAPGGLFDWFATQMQDKNSLRLPAGVHDRVLDVFQLEKAKADWPGHSHSLKTYLGGLVYLDRAIEQLNNSDAWLRGRRLQLSPDIRILTSRWDWGCPEDYKAHYHKGIGTYHLGNLYKPSRRYEYLIRHTPVAGNEESFLKTDTLMLLHQFDSLRSVEQAMGNIRRFIETMPEETLKQLLDGIGEFTDVHRLKKDIDAVILFQLRQWIYRNVLVIQE